MLITLIFVINTNVRAQNITGNAVIIHNLEAAFPENGSMAEFDSLTYQFQTKVWDKNPYVISHKTIRHWWGNNNRDIIEITEVRTWEDIPKAMQKNNELFMEAWSTKEAREKFNKAYNKYFTGKHSDEIYREVQFVK
jgi:predicted proteasome-type protease